MKVGTEAFVNEILKNIYKKIDDPYLQLPIQDLQNFILIIGYLKEELIN